MNPFKPGRPIDDSEVKIMEHSSILYPRPQRKKDYRGYIYIRVHSF